MTPLSDRIFTLALRTAPSSRRHWVEAARAEAAHLPEGWLPEGWQSLRFSLSVLVLAIRWRLRQRDSLARTGQIMVAAALMLICLGGLVITRSLDTPEMAMPLTTMFVIYGGAGCVAAVSLTALRAVSGLAAVAMGTFGVLARSVPDLEVDRFVAALCMEAAFGFAVLCVTASYLLLVRSEDIPA